MKNITITNQTNFVLYHFCCGMRYDGLINGFYDHLRKKYPLATNICKFEMKTLTTIKKFYQR